MSISHSLPQPFYCERHHDVFSDFRFHDGCNTRPATAEEIHLAEEEYVIALDLKEHNVTTMSVIDSYGPFLRRVEIHIRTNARRTLEALMVECAAGLAELDAGPSLPT